MKFFLFRTLRRGNQRPGSWSRTPKHFQWPMFPDLRRAGRAAAAVCAVALVTSLAPVGFPPGAGRQRPGLRPVLRLPGRRVPGGSCCAEPARSVLCAHAARRGQSSARPLSARRPGRSGRRFSVLRVQGLPSQGNGRRQAAAPGYGHLCREEAAGPVFVAARARRLPSCAVVSPPMVRSGSPKE